MIKRPEDVLIKIEGILKKASEVLNQLEADAFGFKQSGGYELPEAALEGFLEEAETLLEVVLEAADLPATRVRLIEKWMLFEKDGLTETTPHPEVDFLESKPLGYLQKVVEGLRVSLGQIQGGWESYELSKLESLLRRTPSLLNRRKVIPLGELDIQNFMHDYLDALFTDYSKKITIPGAITNFKPDGGLRSLRAAIEFKYAVTSGEVSEAMRGIFEDVSGYSGSLDWTRFYTVIYQTEAFEPEDKFRTELARAGALSWTPILVTGKGRRGKSQRKTKKKTTKKTKKKKSSSKK